MHPAPGHATARTRPDVKLLILSALTLLLMLPGLIALGADRSATTSTTGDVQLAHHATSYSTWSWGSSSTGTSSCAIWWQCYGSLF